MSGSAPAYGLWTLVVLNSLVFIIFAFSFSKPQTPRDCSACRSRWRNSMTRRIPRSVAS